jgi:hypothetical protein
LPLCLFISHRSFFLPVQGSLKLHKPSAARFSYQLLLIQDLVLHAFRFLLDFSACQDFNSGLSTPSDLCYRSILPACSEFAAQLCDLVWLLVRSRLPSLKDPTLKDSGSGFIREAGGSSFFGPLLGFGYRSSVLFSQFCEGSHRWKPVLFLSHRFQGSLEFSQFLTMLPWWIFGSRMEGVC